MPTSTGGTPEGTLAATLLQLIVIVLVARGANLWLRRIGQPGAVGEILAGLMLGPSLLGALFPDLSDRVFRAPSAAPICSARCCGENRAGAAGVRWLRRSRPEAQCRRHAACFETAVEIGRAHV